jgi:integrase
MLIGKLGTQNRCEKIRADGRYADGGGLYLQVKNNGRAKSWEFRYAVGGRDRWMGLGSFQTYTVDEMREEARLCRQMRDKGIDPIEQRKAERHERSVAVRLAAKKDVTVRECGEMYLREQDWRPGSLKQAQRQTSRFIYPKIGDVPVSDIDVDHVEQVVRPILDKLQNSTASQVHMHLKCILDFAKAHEYRSGDNPADLKGPLGVRQPRLLAARARKGEKGNAYLDHKRIGEFMHALRTFRYARWKNRVPTTARALEFLVLTGVRSDQVYKLPWSEIDWKERLWVCPPERHKVGGKTGNDYIVPLSDQAIAILEEMRKLQEDAGIYRDDGYVFVHGPSTDHLNRKTARTGANHLSGQAIWVFLDQGTIGKWYANDGRQITPHGFRTTFGDWSVEHGYEERDSEIALGHTVGNQMRNRYKRNAHRIGPRRQMMQAWANYCDRTEPVGGANVVPMRQSNEGKRHADR